MSLSILPYRAETDLHCRRCLAIGIPAPTILVGDLAFLLATPKGKSYCCEDCFDRLREEAEAIEPE